MVVSYLGGILMNNLEPKKLALIRVLQILKKYSDYTVFKTDTLDNLLDFVSALKKRHQKNFEYEIYVNDEKRVEKARGRLCLPDAGLTCFNSWPETPKKS